MGIVISVYKNQNLINYEKKILLYAIHGKKKGVIEVDYKCLETYIKIYNRVYLDSTIQQRNTQK